MLMDQTAGENGAACWRMDPTMTCLRVASKALGSWKEVSPDVNGGALAAVVGAGALPAVIGVSEVFGGMLPIDGGGLGERKDKMVMVIEIVC
jgi:hypothetical protein